MKAKELMKILKANPHHEVAFSVYTGCHTVMLPVKPEEVTVISKGTSVSGDKGGLVNSMNRVTKNVIYLG